MVTELEGLGFKLNPYDPCITNCMVNRTQQTVCWHVDDLKISHINPAINTRLIGSLAKIYGNKITVSCGKVHEYLGMDLNTSKKGVSGISMIKYLKKTFSDFPEEINKSTRGKYPESPGADYLFKTRDGKESQKLLPKEQA